MSDAVGGLIGFAYSEPAPRERSSPSFERVEPPPPPSLMPTRYEDVCGVSRWDSDNLEEVLDWKDRGDFTFIGWSYEKEPAATCICLKCGNDRFLVGCSDALLTILKCPNCGWERVVHDG